MKKSRLNKDKAKRYMKEYTVNGYNKKDALCKANPMATEESNRGNSTRFHKQVINSDYIMKEFELKDLNVEYVLKSIKRAKDKAEKLNKIGEWLKADELLGDFIRMWSDKAQQNTINIVNKTDIDRIDRLHSRMRGVEVAKPLNTQEKPSNSITDPKDKEA